jgi:AP-1-like transcription factor
VSKFRTRKTQATNWTIRDRLQSMEKFRNGEIDIDNLCSELRAKAKCSEGGAVVDKKDVDKILGK